MRILKKSMPVVSILIFVFVIGMGVFQIYKTMPAMAVSNCCDTYSSVVYWKTADPYKIMYKDYFELSCDIENRPFSKGDIFQSSQLLQSKVQCYPNECYLIWQTGGYDCDKCNDYANNHHNTGCREGGNYGYRCGTWWGDNYAVVQNNLTYDGDDHPIVSWNSYQFMDTSPSNYRVYRNDTEVATITSTSWTDTEYVYDPTGYLPQNYKIRAYHSTYGYSLYSNTKTTITIPD